MSTVVNDGNTVDPELPTERNISFIGIVCLLLFWVVVSYLINLSLLLALLASNSHNLLTYSTAFLKVFIISPVILGMSLLSINSGFLPELLLISFVLGFLALISKTFSRALLFISGFLYFLLFFMYRKLETYSTLHFLFATQRYSFSITMLSIIIMVTLFPLLLANFRNRSLSGLDFFWLSLKWGLVVFLIQGIYIYMFSSVSKLLI